MGLSCPRCSGILDLVPAHPKHEGRAGLQPKSPAPVRALLDNIRSIHNVGSMFRTADGAGLDHLYVCGITATPEHPRLAKTALGAEQAVSWSSHPNAIDLAHSLRDKGMQLWALERAVQSNRLPVAATSDTPVVLIVGNERSGVDPGLLALCDHVIELPMSGGKGSLNAAVAFGIAAYALRFGDVAQLDLGQKTS